MTALRCLRVLWLLGGLALVLPFFRDAATRLPEVARLHDSTAPWSTGGFEPHTATPRGLLPANIATLGSWLGSDAWQGEATTIWFSTSSHKILRVAVAGYPHRPGCSLRAEFRHADGRITSLVCPIADPHETWLPWDLALPADATSVRLVAEDHSSAHAGWLAFSEPFVPTSTLRAAVFQFAQIVTTLCLALTLLWLPGLLVAARFNAPIARTIALFATGPLLLIALGLLVWTLPFGSSTTLARTLTAATWLLLGLALFVTARHAPRSRERQRVAAPATARILAVSALVAFAAVARASFSGGPEGELYAGTIYRSLAVGDRSDSRISFHVVQAAAHRFSPVSPQTEQFFSPWTFFSRGPLAGLVAVPITLATAGLPPPDAQLLAWEPFDRTGFAAYRIVLIALASRVIVALFAVLAPLVGSRWAMIGGGLLALTPFGVHDILFTWPKWEATTWTLLAFLLAHVRRPAAAGFALALGFLFHPLAALWAPWLALWIAARHAGFAETTTPPRPIHAARAAMVAATRFALALACIVGPWMALGALAPHSADALKAGQGGFVEYFRLAEYQPATWATWLQTRWNNLANTFVPFWLFLVNRAHPALSDVYAPSGPLVKFAFGWWNTLPLGAGLALWTLSLFALVAAVRRHLAAILLFLIGPALLLTAYWGATSTGLLRECGHPLFVALIALTVVVAAHRDCGRPRPHPIARLLAHRAFPWLQLPELLLMLWLTTLLNPRPPGVDVRLFDPVYLAFNLAALAAAAWLLSASRIRSRTTHPAPPRATATAVP